MKWVTVSRHPSWVSYKHPPTEPLMHGPAAPYSLRLRRTAAPVGADMFGAAKANALVSVHKDIKNHAHILK